MPRRARSYLPDLPYHVVQRGNNRRACFFEIEDYYLYRQLLRQVMPRYGVVLHAYVLMTNHIHLLLTGDSSTGISQVMKVVGSRFAQHINRKYQRTGTLWEGRHKASAVHAEQYLLTCYRYIELNPVRAGMVRRPEDYKWSSYAANARGDNDDIVTPHIEFLRLGKDPEIRGHRYRELFRDKLSDEELYAIRKTTHYCQPLGDDRFRHQMEEKLGRRLGQMKRGRPRREAEGDG